MALHLAIEASNSAIKLTSISNNSVRETISFSIEGNTSQEKKAHLTDQFRSIPLISQEFEEVTMSWAHSNSTIIPNFVLNDSDPKSVFKLCFGACTENHDVDYNRVAEIGVINVYEIPDWIKTFFVIKFPRIVIQHAGSHTIRKVMKENAFYLKANILLFKDYFLLSMVKHNKLEFYSFFNFQNAEDILYHLTFALQQKEMIDEKGSIEIHNGIESNTEFRSEIESLKQKIKDLKKLELKIEEDFTSKSQLLCV